MWIPIEVAVAHYEACATLGLSHEKQLALGRVAGEKIQGTILGTAVRMAQDVGVTPWTVIPHFQRFWNRAFDGGGLYVEKRGPKEAHFEVHKSAQADCVYWRAALSGLGIGVLELFCRKAYMYETTKKRAPGFARFASSGREGPSAVKVEPWLVGTRRWCSGSRSARSLAAARPGPAAPRLETEERPATAAPRATPGDTRATRAAPAMAATPGATRARRPGCMSSWGPGLARPHRRRQRARSCSCTAPTARAPSSPASPARFFDGPADQTGIDAMKAWNINAVRVPLNEDCWLGINGVPSAYAGTTYQNAIARLGEPAHAERDGRHPRSALDGAGHHARHEPGPDGRRRPLPHVLVPGRHDVQGQRVGHLRSLQRAVHHRLELLGQRRLVRAAERHHATPSPGMASLLKAVRSAGAQNVVILGGLAYSSDMSQWVASVNGIPSLPAPLDGISIQNVAASWHAYDFNSEQSGCPSQYNGYSMSLTCNSAEATATNTSATSVLAAGFPAGHRGVGHLGVQRVDRRHVHGRRRSPTSRPGSTTC